MDELAESLLRFLGMADPAPRTAVTYPTGDHAPQRSYGNIDPVPHPLNTPIGRFGIDTYETSSAEQCAATLPGNHLRRGADEWTVSSLAGRR